VCAHNCAYKHLQPNACRLTALPSVLRAWCADVCAAATWCALTWCADMSAASTCAPPQHMCVPSEPVSAAARGGLGWCAKMRAARALTVRCVAVYLGPVASELQGLPGGHAESPAGRAAFLAAFLQVILSFLRVVLSFLHPWPPALCPPYTVAALRS